MCRTGVYEGTHVEEYCAWRMRAWNGRDNRLRCDGGGCGPARCEAAEGLSLPTRRLDVCSPGRIAVRHGLSARLPACAGNLRCVGSDQDVRHPPDAARLGILPHYCAPDALAAH